MRKKEFELTRGEERLMEMFWNAGRPLTSMELCKMTDEFNDSYVHRLLNSLEKKKMLSVSGLVKSGKQYARSFEPTMTREEYAAFVMEKLGIREEKSFAKVAVALTGKASDRGETEKQELIEELERIVEQLRNS